MTIHRYRDEYDGTMRETGDLDWSSVHADAARTAEPTPTTWDAIMAAAAAHDQARSTQR